MNRDKRFGFIFNQKVQGTAFAYPPSNERLKNYVEFNSPPPPVIVNIIERAVVVKNYQEAQHLASAYPHLIFTTRDGIALFPEGIVVAEASQSGKLSLRRQLDTRNEELDQRIAERTAIDTQLSLLDQQLKELHRQNATDTQELVSLIRQRSETEGVLSSVRRTDEETERARKRLIGELSTNRTQGKDLEKELARAKNEQQAEHARQSETNGRIAAIETELSVREAAAKKHLAGLNGTLLKVAQFEERIHALETEIGYLVKEETEAQKEAAFISEERARLETDQKTIEGELAQAGRWEGGTLPDLAKEEERLERELTNNRAALETIREELLNDQIKWFELDNERKRQEREATEIYHANLVEFEIKSEGDLNERLGILTHRLELLGRANPLAQEEYTREKDELDRLLTQRQDVLSAQENLTATIAEIDERVKDQFLSTFSAVRAAFQDLFVEIFGAGEADLILTNPANVWESDIEILARPRGKNLKRLEQLSDGEKALLAICLLFAFYKVRPAPFCFIDEIDAPLDDANVKRFSEFLKELSSTTQIVIITHNRVTVEHADVLFGVTMEKPGISKIVSVRLKDFKDALAPV